MNNYPIGSIIVWKPSRKDVEANADEFLAFAENVVVKKSANANNTVRSHVTKQDGDKEVILDGQQRLTSLFLTLEEHCEIRRGKFAEKLKLCYVLNLPKSSNTGHFSFVFDSEIDTKCHYKMESLYKLSEEEFQKSINSLNKKTDINNLKIMRKKLSKNSCDGMTMSVFEIKNCTYEEALDIFVSVNTTGKRLTKTDLLLSKLASKRLQNVNKNELNAFITSLNDNNRFSFNLDNVLHAAVVLTAKTIEDRALTVKNIGNASTDIDENWGNIKVALQKTQSMLKAKGFYDICLPSYNAIIPIAYYYYSNGRGDASDEKAMQQYLMRSSLKHLYKSHTDGVINRCIASIDKMLESKNKEFDIKMLKKDIPELEVNKSDIEGWLKEEKGEQTKNILCYLQLNNMPSDNDYHQDHLHPYTGFTKKLPKKIYKNSLIPIPETMKDSDKKRWLKRRNTLPNLDMLQSNANEKKNAKTLMEWMNASGNKIQFDPKCGYEFERFEIFYEKRKELIKGELENLFKV